MSNWIRCTDREPVLGDRPILVHFANGSVETVNVHDYFREITAGIVDGVQQYTKWWKVGDPACTHWMELPAPPEDF